MDEYKIKDEMDRYIEETVLTMEEERRLINERDKKKLQREC